MSPDELSRLTPPYVRGIYQTPGPPAGELTENQTLQAVSYNDSS